MGGLGDPKARGVVLQEKTVCQRWQTGGLLYPGPHSKAHLGNSRPRWAASTWEAPETHTGAYRGAEIHGRNVHAQMCPHLHMFKGEGAHAALQPQHQPGRHPRSPPGWPLRPPHRSTQPARSALACVMGTRGRRGVCLRVRTHVCGAVSSICR